MLICRQFKHHLKQKNSCQQDDFNYIQHYPFDVKIEKPQQIIKRLATVSVDATRYEKSQLPLGPSLILGNIQHVVRGSICGANHLVIALHTTRGSVIPIA